MNSFSFEDKDPRFTKLKPSLALRLLSKGLFYIRAMDIPKTLNGNFQWRIQILKELGNDVIVEEQSDNFGQSSKGQASQTEAQRQTSGFGRLCRKIQK